jgi:hypothetical protein
MLDPLEKAILVATDRMTRGTYMSTDSDAIGQELEHMGHELPPRLIYGRLFGRLREEGYLVPATAIMAGGRAVHVELTSFGREEARADIDPMEEVHADARRLLASEAFAVGYPGAFEPWAEAEQLLFGHDPESQLATIGFKLRDATQAFAAALVEQYKPSREERDPTRVKNRLKSVVETYKSQLGDRRAAVLNAMVDLWDAGVDLIQRQTHANEKAGRSLTVNDGRRVVFLTMFLMIEFASLLDEIEPPPLATLESAG